MLHDLLDEPEAIGRIIATSAPEKRDHLTLTLADICASRDLRDERAGHVVHGLLGELLRTAQSEMRRRLAEKLADVAWAPHDLIVALANDEIDIARPVIKTSVVLLAEDLIALVEAKEGEHRIAIAQRPGVSEDVCDALAATGQTDVLMALARNLTAFLSETAVSACIDAASGHPPLRRPLAHRDGLTEAAAVRLYAIVGEELRAEISNRFDLDLAAIAEAIDLVAIESVATHSSTPDAVADAAAVTRKLAETGKLKPDFLIQCAQAGQLSHFEFGVSRLSDVAIGAVQSALADGSGWAIALACRACGVNASSFPDIYAAFAKADRAPARMAPDTVRQASHAFESLTPVSAADALRRLAASD